MDRADIAALLHQHLPGYLVESINPLGEGQENAAYEINDDLVFRVSKEPDRVARQAAADREARLLAIVAQVSSLPIPQPLFTADGAMAYRKVPGVPLLDTSLTRRRSHGGAVAATIGAFLAEIHSIPVDLVTGLAEADDDGLAQWVADAVGSYAAVASHLPTDQRNAVEGFLRTTPPDSVPELVFSHNDLGIEHVLVDPDTFAVTGVIDFSDAALVDPAYDFALVLRDLGPDAFDAALRAAFGADDGLEDFRDRAWLYARCSVLEDLHYGLAADHPAYVDKSLVAFEWLFPT